MVSSTEITVQWDASTAACAADQYRVTVAATNVRQCGTTGGTTTGNYVTANQVSLPGLLPHTSYTLTVTPCTTHANGNIITGTPVSIQATTAPEGRFFAGLAIGVTFVNCGH